MTAVHSGTSPQGSQIDVEEILRAADVRVVETWLPDIHGIVRGKRFSAAEFARVIPHAGLRMADAVLCWGRDCNLYEDVAFSNSETGYPDLHVIPMLSTLRPMPWRSSHAAVLCRIQGSLNNRVEVDPRAVLEGQVDALAELGFSAKVGLEYELYLLSPDENKAIAERNCYAFAVAEKGERFLDQINGLADFGVPIEAVETEWGRSQIEISVRPSSPVEAADHAVMLKAAAAAIAREAGLIATFMPKFDPDEPGSGLHVNLSIWDASRRNVFASDSGRDLADRFLAGLIATAADFFLAAAPSVNAYKRRLSGAFAPTTVNWSRSSRTSAIRAMFDREDESRIEYRLPGADANPYLAIGACIAGGLHGLSADLAVPPELQGNSYRQEGELPPLPRSLEEAIASFSASTTVVQRFGKAFVDNYTAILSHEALEFALAVTDWERRRYLRFA